MDNIFFGSTNLDKWGIFRGDLELASQFRISSYVTGDPNDWRGADILAFLTAQKNNPLYPKGYNAQGDDVATGVKNANQHNLASIASTNEIVNLYRIKTGGVVSPYNADMLYETGARVSVNNVEYKSLQDNNKGNAPASSPTYWQGVDNVLGGYIKNPISYSLGYYPPLNEYVVELTEGNYLFEDGTGWATLPAMVKIAGGWTAGNLGGIFSGNNPNPGFAWEMYIIYNATTETSDVIILNGGSVPSGWEIKAYLGTLYTETGTFSNNFFDWRLLDCSENVTRFRYTSLPLFTSSTSASFIEDTDSLCIPKKGKSIIVGLEVYLAGEAMVNNGNYLYRNITIERRGVAGGEYSVVNTSSTRRDLYIRTLVSAIVDFPEFGIRIQSLRSTNSGGSATDSSFTLEIVTHWYIDSNVICY